ncbi:hypothetical protein ACIA8K_26435 [Catenuloplanes sp. NPDC051500]|uniref:hypothetical protein n=1 Tax=Catenuloplanes sp. NPDC051500 TaxID=3363959 RepID=UPI0037969DF5
MRRTLVIIGVVVAVVAVTAGAFAAVRSLTPDHRITFLVDGSAGDLAPVGAAVSAAAGNTGDADSLALRRFGGECGDAGNTSSLVDAGVGNKDTIRDAVGTLTPAGKPTLLAGVQAAIDDFDRRYPFRGRATNRIIVVSRHGADACTADQAAVAAQIQDRVRASGLRLDFRFVGFQVPAEEQESFTALAGTSTPIFPQTVEQLDAVLKQFTIPDAPDASQVVLPPPPDPTAGWTAYANADYDYALRYPPGWVSEPCVLSGQLNQWLAESPDLIPDCVATDAFSYRAWLRVNLLSEIGTASPFPSGEGVGEIVETPVTTASGLTGRRHSSVTTDDLFSPVGTRTVQYLFVVGEYRYLLYFASRPNEPGVDTLLADFDLMVVNTLRIGG